MQSDSPSSDKLERKMREVQESPEHTEYQIHLHKTVIHQSESERSEPEEG